jgi:hypothetical protein
VKEGHVTLDLFLGLGYVQPNSFFIGRRRYNGPTYDGAVSHNAPHSYVSQEALDLGAERVVAFEVPTTTQTNAGARSHQLTLMVRWSSTFRNTRRCRTSCDATRGA